MTSLAGRWGQAVNAVHAVRYTTESIHQRVLNPGTNIWQATTQAHASAFVLGFKKRCLSTKSLRRRVAMALISKFTMVFLAIFVAALAVSWYMRPRMNRTENSPTDGTEDDGDGSHVASLKGGKSDVVSAGGDPANAGASADAGAGATAQKAQKVQKAQKASAVSEEQDNDDDDGGALDTEGDLTDVDEGDSARGN